MKRYYILEGKPYTIKKLIKKFGCFPDACDQVFELKKGESAVLMKLFAVWVKVMPNEDLKTVTDEWEHTHAVVNKEFIYLNC
jgi:hypothetical protein